MSEKTNVTNYEFPTAIIELPSAGKCYPSTSPLSHGTISIKYMTAREEDILSSQNYIKKGIVLDKLFESIVVEPDVNLNDIIIGDKNAILMSTRILGYGPEYEVSVNDPFSGEQQTVVIDLSKIQTKDIDINLLNSDNLYEFKLPRGGNIVKFKLLTHGDEVEITRELASIKRNNKSQQLQDVDISTRLRYMIQSVDDKSDIAYINKWIKNEFLAIDVRKFREYVKSISPDIDLKFNFVSDVTGDTEALNIPIGINFFYPTN